MAVRVCEHCGREYEGAAQSRFCSDAHRKAFARARAEAGVEIRAEQVRRGVQAPKRREELGPDGRPSTLRGLMSAAKLGELVLTEREEQKIRDYFGYTASERRTFLEREAAAERMMARNPLPKPGSTVIRYTTSGDPVEEPVGPAGLSLIAFPVQTPGDLKPTPEQLAKLGR